MYHKLKIEIILETTEINTLENAKKRTEQILENMLKTRKAEAVCMYRISIHKLYANFYTANNETFEVK